MTVVNLFKPHTTPRLVTVPVRADKLERGDVLALERTLFVLGESGTVQQPYVITQVLIGRLVNVTVDTGEVFVYSPSVQLPVVTG